MTQELAKRIPQDIVREGAFDLTPHSLSEALTLAEYMSKSELVPQGFRGKPADILIAVQYGAEIGLKPLQALAGIAVINGRACIWGDALLALVLDSGLMTNYKEMSFEEIEAAQKAVFWCTRKGQPEAIQREYSVKDAQKAKLWNGKDTWVKYPWRMLQMRARAFALRDGFADVLKGLSVREEVEDYATPEAPRVLAMPQRLSERIPEQPAIEQEPENLPPVNPTFPTTDQGPVCPKCGATMNLKPAGQKKDGKPYPAFWSCSKYPECKGTAKDSDYQESKTASYSDHEPEPTFPEEREPGQD
jgi:hypothetical protein